MGELMRIVGDSGVELEVDELIGRGLVANGSARLIDAAAVNPPETGTPGTPPPAGGEGGEGGQVPPPAGGDGEKANHENADPNAPKGNASREEWEAYALSKGKTEDDLAGKTRDDIKGLFQ